jgi:hypothetical protein
MRNSQRYIYNEKEDVANIFNGTDLSCAYFVTVCAYLDMHLKMHDDYIALERTAGPFSEKLDSSLPNTFPLCRLDF